MPRRDDALGAKPLQGGLDQRQGMVALQSQWEQGLGPEPASSDQPHIR